MAKVNRSCAFIFLAFCELWQFVPTRKWALHETFQELFKWQQRKRTIITGNIQQHLCFHGGLDQFQQDPQIHITTNMDVTGMVMWVCVCVCLSHDFFLVYSTTDAMNVTSYADIRIKAPLNHGCGCGQSVLAKWDRRSHVSQLISSTCRPVNIFEERKVLLPAHLSRSIIDWRRIITRTQHSKTSIRHEEAAILHICHAFVWSE